MSTLLPVAPPAPIVSLTTTSSRIATVSRVLDSLLNQSLPPSEIHLWVSREPYLRDRGIEESTLPDAVRALRDRGKIFVRWTPNIGPYRKLVPLLHERWADRQLAIVTADDDTLYPRHWLLGLHRAANDARDAVIAYRVREMRYRGDALKPYAAWFPLSTLAPRRSRLYFPTGKDGVLYRPSFFTEQVFEEGTFRRLCPTGDDVWFRAMTLLGDVDAVRVAKRHLDFPGIDTGDEGLFFSTNSGGRNDHMIEATYAHLGLSRARVMARVPWQAALPGRFVRVEQSVRKVAARIGRGRVAA